MREGTRCSRCDLDERVYRRSCIGRGATAFCRSSRPLRLKSRDFAPGHVGVDFRFSLRRGPGRSSSAPDATSYCESSQYTVHGIVERVGVKSGARCERTEHSQAFHAVVGRPDRSHLSLRCIVPPWYLPGALLPREVHQGSSGAHPGHGGALEHLARIWRIPK